MPESESYTFIEETDLSDHGCDNTYINISDGRQLPANKRKFKYIKDHKTRDVYIFNKNGTLYYSENVCDSNNANIPIYGSVTKKLKDGTNYIDTDNIFTTVTTKKEDTEFVWPVTFPKELCFSAVSGGEDGKGGAISRRRARKSARKPKKAARKSRRGKAKKANKSRK